MCLRVFNGKHARTPFVIRNNVKRELIKLVFWRLFDNIYFLINCAPPLKLFKHGELLRSNT